MFACSVVVSFVIGRMIIKSLFPLTSKQTKEQVSRIIRLQEEVLKQRDELNHYMVEQQKVIKYKQKLLDILRAKKLAEETANKNLKSLDTEIKQLGGFKQ
jgi:uncharacterized coiled-coil protein SlyX